MSESLDDSVEYKITGPAVWGYHQGNESKIFKTGDVVRLRDNGYVDSDGDSYVESVGSRTEYGYITATSLTRVDEIVPDSVPETLRFALSQLDQDIEAQQRKRELLSELIDSWA